MENEQLQKENPLLYLFFVVSGTLFIILSFALRAQNYGLAWVDITIDVLLNVGASLIVTAGVAYLYQKFGTSILSNYLEKLMNNFSITQRAMELGIRNLWRERRHVPSDMWNTFTGTAASEVWLLGMAELGFAEDPKFHAVVSEGTAKGCNFRFLLLNPESAAAAEVDENEGGAGQLQGRIRLALQKFAALQTKNAEKKGKVEIRLHANLPQVSIVRSDDEVLVTPYMYHRPGNSSFTFLAHRVPTGIFDQYIAFFEEIWSTASVLKAKPDQE